MQRTAEDVEIQGPPIDEIQKRSSCLKQGCVSALVFVFGVLMLLVVVMQVFVKPHTDKLDDIPRSFPESVPLYDEDNLDSIRYTPGDERGEAIEFLAFVPKAILSPLILALESADVAAGSETETLWESFIRILGTPVADHRNLIVVEWSELRTNAEFLHSFYKTKLENVGFVETIEKQQHRSRYVHPDGITVIFDIKDDGIQKNGTDHATLRVYYPR